MDVGVLEYHVASSRVELYRMKNVFLRKVILWPRRGPLSFSPFLLAL
jgi:hypothetical protein